MYVHKKNVFVWIIMGVFLFLPLISANVLDICNDGKITCLKVNIKITPYEYKDAFVVSDFVYYNITFKNEYNYSTITDNLVIQVIDPLQNTIFSESFSINLSQGEEKHVISKGSLEGEKAAIPLKTIGTYQLIIKSGASYFYETKEKDKWIRQTTEHITPFDTMPKWQYELWKSEEEANDKIISFEKDSKDFNQKNSKASQKVYVATILLIVFGIIQLLFMASQIASSPNARKAFLKISTTLLMVVFMIFLSIILVVSLIARDFSLWIKLITAIMVLIAIMINLKNFKKTMKSINRN